MWLSPTKWMRYDLGMAGHVEIERKYELPSGFKLPDLTTVAGVARTAPPAKYRLDAIYYDTADLRLARHRVTLRRRQGGHDAGWHIKRPGVIGRSEHQYPATDGPGVPTQVAADVAAITRGAGLAPIARVRTRRQEIALAADDGTVLALVALDKVSGERLLAPTLARDWRELEVELVDGDLELLDDVERALDQAGAVPAGSASKLAQTLADATPDGPDDSAGSLAGRALAGYLREQRDALLHNDPLVRAGDADGVHDMRVASRRLRSTLATFADVIEGGRPLGTDLKWLAELLGAVRDRDVLVELITADANRALPQLIRVPVVQRVRRRVSADQMAARQHLAEAMARPRYWSLLDRIDALADRPAADLSEKALVKSVRRRLSKADCLMEKACAPAGSIDEVDERDLALHEARKAYKKARYAVEATTAFAPDQAKRLATRLKRVQEALGEQHDAVVAAVLLAEVGDAAYRDGSNAFPYGQLSGRQRVHADGLRATALARAGKAAKAKVRDWLKG
jgi:CHAD domain-containing protein